MNREGWCFLLESQSSRSLGQDHSSRGECAVDSTRSRHEVLLLGRRRASPVSSAARILDRSSSIVDRIM